MKTLQTAVLLALLTLTTSAELPKCPAGYENQTFDRDTFGYCTRIPSLHEEADRAEAFVKYGIPHYRSVCKELQREGLKNNIERERVEELEGITNKMALITVGSMQYTLSDRRNEPDARRLDAAATLITEEMKECHKLLQSK